MYRLLIKRRKYRNKLKHRRALLAAMPHDSVCAEVGVWKGDFTKLILEVAKPRELHLIDPWEFQGEFPDIMFGGGVAKGQADMDLIYEGVRQRFKDEPSVHFHRGYSAETLKKFPDEFFDWVYIDGNHYYEFVSEDLRLSWAKVKDCGFVTGDDYTWQPGDAELASTEAPPVRQAVEDFMVDEGVSRGSLKVMGSQFILQRSPRAG